jgi:Zn-dependent peptidase ImmA (M78 family)
VYLASERIIQKAKKVVRDSGTRDAGRIARDLGLTVMPRPFKLQKGAYMVIERNPFIFIKENLHPVLYDIVLLHEIGHDRNHRGQAVKSGGFREFNIFDVQASRWEYEANLFASEVALPDDDVLELIDMDYTIQQIASELRSDFNLVAIKIDTLISKGHRFRSMEHRNDFLKYSR